jgi:hypothetical protein
VVVVVRVPRVRRRTLGHRRTENFLAVAFAKNRPFLRPRLRCKL